MNMKIKLALVAVVLGVVFTALGPISFGNLAALAFPVSILLFFIYMWNTIWRNGNADD